MHLLTFRGIPLRLHISFVLLAAALIGAQALTGGLSTALGSALLGVGLFGSVLLHELGHALAARRFGIGTRSITLYPFGGIAALTAEPDDPRAELWIALAGPAVNFGLAALALPLALLSVPMAATFAGMNVALGLFNLLPAFPMDGGRVLRAGLARRQGYLSATARALSISRWFAWGFIGLGAVTASLNLLLVGGFLLIALRTERHRLARRVALAQLQAQAERMRIIRPQAATLHQHGWQHPAY